MKEFLEKLRASLNQLENEHGEIVLFALFQRDNPLELWDLIVSASWLHAYNLESLQTVCSSIQEILTGNEILKISHVVILNCEDPTVVYLRENYNVSNGHPEEMIDCEELSDRLGFTIKRGRLLRCRKISSLIED